MQSGRVNKFEPIDHLERQIAKNLGCASLVVIADLSRGRGVGKLRVARPPLGPRTSEQSSPHFRAIRVEQTNGIGPGWPRMLESAHYSGEH
jgi:hypothetical protein